MTNVHFTRPLLIGGLTALLGIQGLTAAQINNCADWNPCCFDYGLNPPPTCPTCCGCTWYGEIDYLYWKPFVENAQPCLLYNVDKIPGNPNAAYTINPVSRPKDFHYDWDSGFRVALGYGFPCDKWGLALSWSHFRTDAKFAENGSTTSHQDGSFTDVKVPLPGFFNGPLSSILQLLGHSSLSSKWEFQFNQIDLDFFRDFYVGCSLSIKPYVGLRALIVNNTIKTISEYDDAAPTILQANIAQNLRSNFKAFGLKGGLESFWEVMCGLGVYGNVGASIIYANYDTSNKTYISQLTLSSERLHQNIETPYKFQTLKMMSDLAIGVQWREPINCNQNLFVIKAGWEHHMILQGSQFQTILTGQSAGSIAPPSPYVFAGDISLYGFVFSIGLSF